jgi:hypothetical protein
MAFAPSEIRTPIHGRTACLDETTGRNPSWACGRTMFSQCSSSHSRMGGNWPRAIFELTEIELTAVALAREWRAEPARGSKGAISARNLSPHSEETKSSLESASHSVRPALSFAQNCRKEERPRQAGQHKQGAHQQRKCQAGVHRYASELRENEDHR